MAGKKMVNIGTRAEVMHGTAKKTSGGLKKEDLMYNKAGRIVSKEKHFTAKKEMRLLKHGYGTKKGKFGYVKVAAKKGSRSKSRKMRGGNGMGQLSPADVNASMMIKDVVPQPFGPLQRALVGGKRHSRKMRGGLPYGNAMAPADAMASGIDGQGITNYASMGSDSVQIAAGMAGGKRRRHRSRSRGRRMRGGTNDRRFLMGAPAIPSGPTLAALNA